MKKTVNILLDSSCHLREKEKLAKSLDKAKEAVREDKEFSKFCQSNEVPELHDICLSFAVLFNLAICFEQNEQYDQAMSTYKLMLKTQNSAPNARNMHVNIGNLYYRQEQYKAAIKEYRIALDQVPETQRKMGFLISSNIGKALLKLGQYREAIAIFETIMSSSPNNETGFNLLVCYFALGDKHNMKRSFCSLIGRTLRDSPNEALLDLAPKTEETGLHYDPLTQYEAQIQKKTEETLLTAARLIAPCLDESDWSLGYLWVNEQLRPKYDDVANQMEIELALSYIERHDCHTAIKILKSFERKESTKRTAAATNLSFLQFQEGKYDEASRYADIALVTNRYNSKALVNKGNCLFVSGDHEGASSLYREAISLQANCVEAIYNLGMISLDKGQLNEAREVFNKFNVLVPNDPCAMYNIADSLDESGDTAIAIEWYEMLGASVPNDSGILARLAELSTKENNEGQVIHYNTETLRRDPVHIESLNSLVNWLVKNEMFEKSILMFERLRLIQPKEGKWALMLAHCHRRLGNKSQALEVYKQIYHIDAGNVDCKYCCFVLHVRGEMLI